LLPRTALLLAAALLLAGCGKPKTTPEMYKKYCARCHGPSGEGNPKSLRLYPNLDLVESPMVRRGDRAAVRQRIAEGHGPMPAYQRRLTPEEIERMVDFTFQLARSPKETP
jgi:mono/diheme cytochrome c family protein